MNGIRNFSACRFFQSKVEVVLRLLQSYIPCFEKLSFKSHICYSEPTLGTTANFTEIISAELIPEESREPYIYTGYRHRTDFIGSLRSLFWLHNEIFNCWSHILGILMVMFYVFEEYTSSSSSPIMYLYLFACFCFMFGSSFAHTFCCYNRFSRDALFTVDYIGLTIFTAGSSIAYVSFSFPIELWTKSGLFGFTFLDTYLIFLTLCSMVSIFQSVWTRTLPLSVSRSIIRLCAFASPGVLMSFPILYKIFACLSGHSINRLHYCASSTVWLKQFITCIISCLFYISRFPECFYPGKFDYFGHSHNLFHVCALLGLHYQKTAIFLDFKFAQIHDLVANTSMQLSLTCFALLFLSIFATCFYFRHLFTVKPQTLSCKCL